MLCPEEDTKCVEEDADEKYEGFSVDLVKNIFKILRKNKFNYTYEFRHKEDEYGKYDPETKKWNGLIGELLDKVSNILIMINSIKTILNQYVLKTIKITKTILKHYILILLLLLRMLMITESGFSSM